MARIDGVLPPVEWQNPRPLVQLPPDRDFFFLTDIVSSSLFEGENCVQLPDEIKAKVRFTIFLAIRSSFGGFRQIAGDSSVALGLGDPDWQEDFVNELNNRGVREPIGDIADRLQGYTIMVVWDEPRSRAQGCQVFGVMQYRGGTWFAEEYVTLQELAARYEENPPDYFAEYEEWREFPL